jgi:hypothetical protein
MLTVLIIRMAQDTFIGWVEEFDEDGVDLRDGEGVVWIVSEGDSAF